MKTLPNYLAAAMTAALLTSTAAWADSASDTLNISITIQPACTLNSLSDASATHPTGTTGAQSITGNATVTCNNGVPYTLAMGAGTNALGGQRRVSSGSNYLNYVINQGSSATPWGTNGTAADTSFNSANDLNAMGNGSPAAHGYTVAYTLAGTEAAGTYLDQVLVTLEF